MPEKKKLLLKKLRTTWEGLGFQSSPSTRVIPNKKGKGSYRRVKKADPRAGRQD